MSEECKYVNSTTCINNITSRISLRLDLFVVLDLFTIRQEPRDEMKGVIGGKLRG